MIKIYENYSDQEYQLYEIIGWAMLGVIDTKNEDRPSWFGGFLCDLFLDSRGGDLAGEPGWSLERIELEGDFRGAHPYISDESADALEELKQSGENQAFWMDTQEQGENVVSKATFWKVVADSLNEFVRTRPERRKELELITEKFPQLLRE